MEKVVPIVQIKKFWKDIMIYKPFSRSWQRNGIIIRIKKYHRSIQDLVTKRFGGGVSRDTSGKRL